MLATSNFTSKRPQTTQLSTIWLAIHNEVIPLNPFPLSDSKSHKLYNELSKQQLIQVHHENISIFNANRQHKCKSNHS